MFSQYISNGEISISKEEWQAIKSEYDKEYIIQQLTNEILAGNINIPMKHITEQDARDSFVNLCNYTCNDYFTDNVVSRYDYALPFSGRYIDESNVGNAASDYFHQTARYMCDSINAPSPYRVWHSEKFLHSYLSALWSLKASKIDTVSLRSTLGLRKYIASQYKPAIAKSIYEKYHSKDVIDFSAGWGDRLCGFAACKNTESYIGIDPNTEVYKNYKAQTAMYSQIMYPDKRYMFVNSPAEDVSLGNNMVDTIFTSPPYFNVERYSQDSTQSFKRYKTLNKWLQGFLYPTLASSYSALKRDGYLIINISDVYSGHKINNICDNMNAYLFRLGMKFEECIGMRMAKRPNSGALKDKMGIFVEPIWVWRKL